MAKETVSVEVEKSGYEVMVGLAKIVAAVKQSLADGFQPGQDLPVLIMAAVADLPAVLGAAVGVPGDLAEDKLAFVKGVNLGAYDIADVLLK